MLPDMSDTLTEWEQAVILKTAVRTTVDFEPSVVITPENIRAVVQPATPEQLSALDIDISLKYRLFHSKVLISMGQYVEFQGVNYKVVTPSDWTDYGFSEVIGEQVKGNIV